MVDGWIAELQRRMYAFNELCKTKTQTRSEIETGAAKKALFHHSHTGVFANKEDSSHNNRQTHPKIASKPESNPLVKTGAFDYLFSDIPINSLSPSNCQDYLRNSHNTHLQTSISEANQN